MASSSANVRAVLSVFEKYQRERLAFVQTVADLASRDTNIDSLHSAGVLYLLRPLLLDNVPAIQQAAALSLGRLANYSEELAQAVVDSDILPQLVYSLSEQNRFYKKAASFVLRAISKHSAELAQAVVNSNALSSLAACLEEFDPGVKESAAWALGYIARHNSDLAQAVVDSGCIPLLILCIQEPELTLKRFAVSALSDIAKHSPELAQSVVDANAIIYITPLLAKPDPKLRRQACSALSQIAKHSVDLAETVVDGEIFPNALHCLRDTDPFVRKNAATLICEITKHSPELAQLVVNSGGTAAIVDYLENTEGNAVLPAIMTLGYISAFSETLALAAIAAKAVQPLTNALSNEQEDYIKAACAWSLGQMGRHSPDHAKVLTDAGVLPKLLKVLNTTNDEDEASADLKAKVKRALKSILEKTLHMEALEPLLNQSTPPNILKYVIGQFAKIVPQNVAARRAFVTSGGLQRVQEIAASYGGAVNVVPVNIADGQSGKTSGLVGTKLGEYIRIINECYPEEIVRYYSPGYSATLLEKIDDYSLKGNEQSTKAAPRNTGASNTPRQVKTAGTKENIESTSNDVNSSNQQSDVQKPDTAPVLTNATA